MQNSKAETMNRMTMDTRMRRAIRGRMEFMGETSPPHRSPLAGRGG
jgi:hypothetical protein